MYTGRFSLFCVCVSEMGDVKALISHQMFGAKEIATVCGFLEKKSIGYFDYPTLC